MIWSHLKKSLPSLPRAQKIVAKYILGNPPETIFMTSQQLGQKSGTSEATVVRLATTLGFQGFPEFKEALQKEAKQQLSTLGRLKRHQASTKNSMLADIVLSEIEGAAEALATASDLGIEELAAAICESDAVYIIGLRSARSLAIYMQFYLSWFLPQVYLPENDFFESYLVSAPKNSIVVGISFPRYTRLTVECLGQAKKMGFRTAAITDSPTSPLARITDISVISPCFHIAHIDSLMIPSGMVNAILIEVTNRLGRDALDRLSALEAVWADDDIYC